MRSGGWKPFWAALFASLLVLVPLVGGTVLLSRQQLSRQLRQAARSESGVPIQLPKTTDQLTVLLCVSGEQPGFVLAYLNATVDGGIYGVPFTTNTWFMYYNKKTFTEDDVKSLDTMLEKGKVSFPLTNSWYIAAFYLANGGTLFGDGTDNDAGINFGGDNGKAVTDYLVDLVNNKNFVNDESGVGISGMTDGSISAMFSGSWDYAALHDALGDDLGIAVMPTAKIGGADKQLLSFAGSKAIAVNPNCEYPQVAVALALYLGNEASQESHYTARNIVPCNTSLLESDTVKGDALVAAQNATFDTTAFIQPFVPKMGNYWTPAENFGKSLVNGEVTHDNAADMTESFNTSLNTDVAQ